jgi:signal recognition particle receptor subunit beta
VASHYATAGILAFVVDAADAASFRKAAQFLLDIFTNTTVQQNAPLMCIVCNKTDLPNALGVDGVRQELEKELTELKGKPLPKSAVAVGRADAPFDFGVDAPCPVSFVSCSAAQGELTELSTFILKNY